MRQFDYIEGLLKEILLKKVSISLRNKCLVEDTLLFYDFKDFYFRLTFSNTKKFIVPYPFYVSKTKDKIQFFYSNSYLHNDDVMFKFKMKYSAENSKSKFYNSSLIIKLY